MRNLAKLSQYVEAADVRHHDIEENEVDRFGGVQSVERGAGVQDEFDPVGAVLELELDDPPDVRFVIHDQDGSL